MPARARKKRTAPPGAEYGTPAQVAEHLIRSEGTLANWRSQGKGPRWKKLGGSIRYDWADVYEWEKSEPSGGAGVRRGAA
jgi:hypothetical protein